MDPTPQPILPVYTRVPFLKVKIKSLAAEARIIRHRERKMKGLTWGPSRIRGELHHHRTVDVRRESRAAQLAYGFLRGRPYQVLESKHHNIGELRIAVYNAGKMAARFSNEDSRVISQRFAAWLDEAGIFLGGDGATIKVNPPASGVAA